MLFDDLKEWLQLHISAGYVSAIAPWVETGTDGAVRYCVIGGDSGPAPDVEDRRKNFNVYLLGPKNSQGAAMHLLQDAEAVIAAIMLGEVLPCGAANIAALGEPIGPGLTTENRPWVQINLQITM